MQYSVEPIQPRRRRRFRVVLAFLVILPLVGGYMGYRWFYRGRGQRVAQVWTYFRDPDLMAEKTIRIGERCGAAPFVMPTDGLIGFVWGDSFRPGHTHQGLDIFGGTDVGIVPVVAAYDGYLTRLPEWKSSVIIRIPSDPLNPARQIWTYYTHLADENGESYVSPVFPPGTTEVFVSAGTFLGYQGNYSGDPGNPTGVHLHFSVVKDQAGTFMNELEIRNTYDPSPYLGMALNAETNRDEIPVCKEIMEPDV